MWPVGSWFPDKESNLCPLHWEPGPLATGPPVTSLYSFLNRVARYILIVLKTVNSTSDRGGSNTTENVQHLDEIPKKYLWNNIPRRPGIPELKGTWSPST